MKFDFTLKDQVGIVTINGRLDASNVALLKKEFKNFLTETTDFVFDLSGLEFLDSSGLGAIISCLKNTIKKGGDIKLAHLTAKVKMVFEVTRAEKIFAVFPDQESALASFRRLKSQHRGGK